MPKSTDDSIETIVKTLILRDYDNTYIPERVIEDIINEMHTQNITRYDIDLLGCRRILKKLNYRIYYEHVPCIVHKIKYS